MKNILLSSLLFVIACSGTPPELGVSEGRLKICPDSPNCVISYKNSPDDDHYIDPFKIVGDKDQSYAKIVSILEKEERCKIINKEDNYIRVEFTTALLRFVDDVEILFPAGEETEIHIRSSSRIGHSDMGVNRKRVEMIRFKYHQNDY